MSEQRADQHSSRLARPSDRAGSALASVAQHEQKLQDRLSASQAEAREIVEQGRANGQRILQDREAALNQEIARLRREAEQRRLQEFQETISRAERELEGVQSAAERRVPELSEKVLSLILPKTD